MYDYHAEVAPHAFDETRYPTPDEQRRFVTAYVDHRPQHPYPEHHRRHRHHLYQHRPDHEASAAEAGGRADGAAISGSMTPGQTPRLSPQKPPMTSSSSSASLWMASHHRPNVSNDAAATASRPFSLGGPALNVEGGKGDAATQTQNGNAQPTEENGGSATEPSDTSTQAPAGGWREADRLAEEARESWIRELLAETRIWRVANSAQWVAWGIVQAKLPGIVGIGDADGVGGPTGDESAEAQAKQEEDETAPTEAEKSAQTDDKGEGNAGPPAGQENEKGTDAEAESADGEEEDVFDYLGYAQERALFFWGDCVLLGIIKEDELPEQLRKKLKLVDY